MKKYLFIVVLFFTATLIFANENLQLKNIKQLYLEKKYDAANHSIQEFLNNENYELSNDEKLFCIIYQLMIEIERNNSKENAQNILNIIDENEKLIKKSKLKGLSDSFYSLSLYCNVILEDEKNARKNFENINNPDENSVFLIAYCYFKNEKDFNTSISYLENYLAKNNITNFNNSETQLLYAKNLIQKENYEKAEILYSTLFSENLLSEEEIFEYAKVLFIREKYQSALVKVSSTNHPLKNYLCGLCSFNMRDWEKSKNYFSEYLLKNASIYGYIDSAKYYKAYSIYKLADYKGAYKLFVEFADSTTELNFARSAYELAAKCAVLENDFYNAAIQAEKLIKISFKDEEKEKAVYFCAQIYFDCKEYDKAYNLLLPYTYEKSDFSLKCYKLIADIYVKSEDLVRADSVYEKIIKDYPNTLDSQDASIKRAELFYTHNDFKKSAKYYSEYISHYANGKFLDSALYFCGESYLKIQEYNQSIQMNKKLINNYPKSIYIYGSYKNLFDAYYETENYSEAKVIYDYLMKNYKDQAVSDDILSKLQILEKVKNGFSKKSAEKNEEYLSKGGNATLEGRLIGYELFEIYLSEENEIQAKKIAGELLNINKTRDESEYFYLGEISDFFAKFEEASKKAELLLQAVEFYRKSPKDTSVQETLDLYSAVDAFLKDKKTADARETAEVLKKLYPDSRQAKNVDKLF